MYVDPIWLVHPSSAAQLGQNVAADPSKAVPNLRENPPDLARVMAEKTFWHGLARGAADFRANKKQDLGGTRGCVSAQRGYGRWAKRTILNQSTKSESKLPDSRLLASQVLERLHKHKQTSMWVNELSLSSSDIAFKSAHIQHLHPASFLLI